MQIAITLFDRFTALDAVGPYELLSRAPGAEVVFVAERTGPVANDTGSLHLVAHKTLAEVPYPDLVIVPGGPGQSDQMENGTLLGWLRTADTATTWTTSVCTGSLLLGRVSKVASSARRAGPTTPRACVPGTAGQAGLSTHALAAAGLPEGRRATSHWLALEALKQFGAEPTGERVVFDGKYVTAAGVSSGIDMGLALLGRIAGDDTARSVQLLTEYDPQPPYDCGSPEKAPAALVEQWREKSRHTPR
ncbi:DJ-1/PfpI family protein [Streptomyces bacillaris]|uniref:DJ-1/PfpI family protein n=1 Tax=Streptomyces bacillaris TaxID=68179 RepID=UPI003460D5B4